MNTNSLTKICLFGGALAAAGLSNTVQADEFFIGQSSHNNGIDAGPIVSGYAGMGNYALNTIVGSAIGPTIVESSFDTGTSATVSLNSEGLVGTVEKEIDSFGYFAFVTSFTVDVDTEVTISWDASTEVPWIDRRFRVWQSLGPTLFEYDVNDGPHSGSMTVTLTAGQLYWTDALYRSIWDNGNGSFSITFPESSCPVDLNDDGELDFIDISAFLSSFTEQTSQSDLNGDDAWDFIDISAFINGFSTGCP